MSRLSANNWSPLSLSASTSFWKKWREEGTVASRGRFGRTVRERLTCINNIVTNKTKSDKMYQKMANLQRCRQVFSHQPADDKSTAVAIEKVEQDSLVLQPAGELPLLLRVRSFKC